jgi:hypothetical protein
VPSLQAAKSVGSTLRAFQPAIKEVVEVSQDLRGTLEKELGLDELKEATKPLGARPRMPGGCCPCRGLEGWAADGAFSVGWMD